MPFLFCRAGSGECGDPSMIRMCWSGLNEYPDGELMPPPLLPRLLHAEDLPACGREMGVGVCRLVESVWQRERTQGNVAYHNLRKVILYERDVSVTVKILLSEERESEREIAQNVLNLASA